MLCNAYDGMSSFSARSKHQRCYSQGLHAPRSSPATSGTPRSSVLDLPIKLHVLLLELESRFLKLLVSGFQLLHPHVWLGCCLPLGTVSRPIAPGYD